MSVTIEKIQRLVAAQLGIRGVKPKDRLVDDLGAQSADVVNLLASVEDQYDIEIDEDEIPEIVTVTDLYNAVKSLL